MVKAEFDPKQADWFMDKKVWLDLGYLGFSKDYQTAGVEIPIKRPQRKKKSDPKIEFTEKQKAQNKEVGSNRIYVEHAIGGMKRYRFLSDRLRCRDASFYSIVLGVCAGLWNFQLNC